MRLIDFHNDWLLQYAGETTIYPSEQYQGVQARWPQSQGYLQATSAAVLACFRRATDWTTQANPWGALDALITRIEAEFSGRLLRDPADLVRWKDDPEGLTWAMLGVEGFDFLVKSTDDLEHLDRLIHRGVKVFQPAYTSSGHLAGSSAEGDDRGLLDLGKAFLERLGQAAKAQDVRVVVDLAHLNPKSCREVLDWLEAASSSNLLAVYSHGILSHEGFATPRAITRDNLRRLRALGGWIGLGLTPPFITRPEQLVAAIEATAAIPFLGKIGYAGIGLGTDFLGIDETLPDLSTAEKVVDWARRRLPAKAAEAIVWKNGLEWVEMVVGVRNSAV